MDQETASVLSLLSAESGLYAAVKTGFRRAGNPERGTGLGDRTWAELKSGCLSNDVLGQQQRIGQGEARRHAEFVETGGIIQGRQVRHEEGRHEREPSRLNDETAAEPTIEQLMNIIGYEFVRTTGIGRVGVSIGENMMAFQISVPAVGHGRWTGGISVPVTNSMKCGLCKRA